MIEPAADLLVLGWGNPGRGDDGLGPAFAAAVEAQGLAGVRVEADYQLQVEDAAALAGARAALLVDAAQTGPEPFSLARVLPVSGLSFSSHHLGPAALAGLARDCFGAAPPVWVLGIRGYHFAPLTEGLSPAAAANLEAALLFFQDWWADRSRRPFPAHPAGLTAGAQGGGP